MDPKPASNFDNIVTDANFNDVPEGSSKCPNAVVVLVPMHRWSFFLGHEKCDEMFARMKAGQKVEFRMRVLCGECEECEAYEDHVKQMPLRRLEEVDGGDGWLKRRCNNLIRRLKERR